jgi:hypothetical protein
VGEAATGVGVLADGSFAAGDGVFVAGTLAACADGDPAVESLRKVSFAAPYPPPARNRTPATMATATTRDLRRAGGGGWPGGV